MNSMSMNKLSRPNNASSDSKAALRRVNPWRASLTFAVMLLACAGFAWKLVDLQLSPDDDLVNKVGSSLREEEIAASRGNIMDRQGRLLAFSVTRPSVVGNPREIKSNNQTSVDEIVTALSEVLTTDPAEMARQLRRDKSFVYLERQVTPEVGEAVISLGLPSIRLEEEQYRENPNGPCSGLSVVGQVNRDHVGSSGLEKQYQDQLEGTPGLALRQTQPGGVVQIPDGYHVIKAHTPGTDLKLTIDRNIQYEAEQILARGLQESQGDLAVAIVSNPQTGEIYAMASTLRNAESGEIVCSAANLAAVWSYEPGSTMKTITFSGVFDNGAWEINTAVDVPATIEVARERGVANHVYRDKRIPHGETLENPPATILQRSSNTGTVLLAQALGASALQQTFESFGFGSPTSLAFPGESHGILQDLDAHSLALSNAAIGQSVAVTPLQMLQAYNTLGNDGVRVEPTLLAEAHLTQPDKSVRVVSAQTAQAIIEMLQGVVSDGTGRRAAIPGYRVAGKTGTSWQPCGDQAGYICSEEGDEKVRHYTASFIGVVENDQGPVLSAIVLVDNPRGEKYGGGSVAAPLFAELSSYALQQLHLAPLNDGTVVEQRIRAEPAVAQAAVASQTDEVALP